jgi:hypothetical protein
MEDRKVLVRSSFWSVLFRHQPHHLLSGADDSDLAPAASRLKASKTIFACMVPTEQEFKHGLMISSTIA